MKDNGKQRSREGVKAGILGVICNLILAASKFLIGITSDSIMIIADGANYLTDSFSSLLTVLGFQMEAIEEDEMHPYGHGRIEYVMGFLISLMILGTGIGVGKEAVMGIFYPRTVCVTIAAGMVLAINILGKLGIAFYYQMKNKKMRSPALEAVRKDSFDDACVSALTMAGFFLTPYSRLPLDGILGLIMAVHIFGSGINGFRENLTLLLGAGPGRKTESELRELLSGCAEIESVEEIAVHDYGPSKKVAVAEVSFVRDCDREVQRRTADDLIRLCKDTMNIDLSLYGPPY